MRCVLILFCLLFGIHSLLGQLSTQHYIPPISISQEQGNNTPNEQWIYISTPSTSEVSYVIKPIGGGDDIIGYVSNDSPAKHTTETSTDPYNTQLIVASTDSGSRLSNKGYLIEAEKPIYVSVRLASDAQAGALVSKGATALGQEFLLGSFSNLTNNNNGLANFFSLLATENDTEIEIRFPKVVFLENVGSTDLISVRLNKDEAYVGILDVSETLNNRDGLLGAKVTSDKPIIVNTGSAAGSNGTGNGRDFGIDQIVDTRFAGKEYIFIRGAGDDAWENVMIIPTQPNTSIQINGRDPQIIPGAYLEIEGEFYDSDGNMFVQSDKPVVAYQGIGGVPNSEPNQGMFYVPPLSCSSRGDVNNIPLINEIGTTSLNGDPWRGAIGVVAKTGAEVWVNGRLESGTVVSGRTDYSTYLINNLNESTYSIRSDDELYVSYYTYSGPATSGSFYSGFPTNPEFSYNINLNSLGNCLQNGVELTINGTENLDDYGWWYNPTSNADPGSWVDLSLSSTMLIPSSIGWYQVRGEINCPGEFIPLSSEPTFIGNCPPDEDNDGINDNIDRDNDNDGIRDEVESAGGILVNLNNPISPTLNPLTSSGSVHGVSTSSVLNSQPGASFVGDVDGSFKSELVPSVSNSQSYKLLFSEPINLVFKHKNGVAHNVISKEFFSLSSEDENITISLLDPDDQLLVDTNFDSAYESGITEYTSSKIFFRFNPAATSGPLTFQFVSASNNGVVFVHETSNISDSSAFEGVFSVVNYPLDSDGDGQADAYDSDSDNDGCSDVLEAGFTDADGDDKVLDGPLTFDDGTVDGQGLVVGHDYTQLPDDNDTNGVYDFQEFNRIMINTPPVDVSHCEGDIALFQVISDGANFQWQVLDASGVWANLSDGGNYSGTNTAQLQINNLTMGLNTSEYRVGIFKNDLVCPKYSSPAKLEVTPLPAPPVLASSKYGFCEDTNPTIGDLITAIGSNVIIYDTATAIIPLPSSTPLSSSVYHLSALDLLGCESAGRTEVEVVVEKILVSEPNILSQECDETDGVRDLKVLTNLRVFEAFISTNFANQQFQYYFDAAHTDELSDPNNHINVDPSDGISPLPSQTIYVKITSVFDADVLVVSQCEASAEIVLETSLAEIPVPVSNVYYACESTDPVEIDGKTSFDASIFNDLNASLLAIPEFAAQPNLKIRYYGSRDDARDKKYAISTSTDYINQYPSVSGINWSDEIWANISVENSGSFTCFGFAKVADLIIVRSPEFDLDSSAVFCINEGTLLIESKNPLDTYDYSWSHVDSLGNPTSFSSTSSDITISAGGTYSLTATTQGAAACSMSKSIVVLESELAQLSQESLIITDLKPNNENTVSVDVSTLGSGDYEYALDSGPFQDSPIFNNVRPGTHTLAAKDKTGCGTAFIDLAIVGYNKYFSPNNDGINDYWKILGVDGTFFSNSKVFVFDRYGRLLSQLDNNGLGWDGTFKGSPMPADDYWFRVELDDGRAFDGHFSLMR